MRPDYTGTEAVCHECGNAYVMDWTGNRFCKACLELIRVQSVREVHGDSAYRKAARETAAWAVCVDDAMRGTERWKRAAQTIAKGTEKRAYVRRNPRVIPCEMCGVPITCKSSAHKYCQRCTVIAKRLREQKYKAARNARKISRDTCVTCGVPIVQVHGNHKYCKQCAMVANRLHARARKGRRVARHEQNEPGQGQAR